MLKIKIIHVDNLQTPVDEQPAQASILSLVGRVARRQAPNRYLSLHR